MQIKTILELLRQTVIRWQKDDAAWMAAALSYYTIFSLAPLILIIFAVLGSVFEKPAIQGELQAQIKLLIGSRAADLIGVIIKSAGRAGFGSMATVFGSLILIFGASSIFTYLQATMNKIWRVDPGSIKALIKTHLFRRIMSIAMIMGTGLLVILFTMAETILAGIYHYSAQILPATIHLMIIRLVNDLVSFGLVTTLIALIFNRLPNVHISWRDSWIGAVFTAILITTGKVLLNLYLTNSRIVTIFGAAGSVIVVLIWFYYSAQIFYLGAEFTYVYTRYRSSSPQDQQ